MKKNIKMFLDFSENMSEPLLKIEKNLGLANSELENNQALLQSNHKLQDIVSRDNKKAVSTIKAKAEAIDKLNTEMKQEQKGSKAYKDMQQSLERLNSERDKAIKLEASSLKKSQSLTKQQSKLKSNISKLAREQSQLNKAKKQELTLGKKILNANKLMIGSYHKLAKSKIDSLAGGFASTAGKATGIGSALVMGAGAVAVNQQVESAQLAKQYGVDTKSYKAWDNVANKFGLSGEHFGDMLEELRNKKGEFEANGEMNAYQEAMSNLNLDFHALEKLKPDEQLSAIFKALEGVEDLDQRASLADLLMGGEANKIVTAMDGKSFEQEISKSMSLDQTTDKTSKNLMALSSAFNDFTYTASNSLSLVASRLSVDLVPILTQATKFMSSAFNPKSINLFFDEVKSGAESLMSAYQQIVDKIESVTATTTQAIDKVKSFFGFDDEPKVKPLNLAPPQPKTTPSPIIKHEVKQDVNVHINGSGLSPDELQRAVRNGINEHNSDMQTNLLERY